MTVDDAVREIVNAVYGKPQAGITDAGDERFSVEAREILERLLCRHQRRRPAVRPSEVSPCDTS